MQTLDPALDSTDIDRHNGRVQSSLCPETRDILCDSGVKNAKKSKDTVLASKGSYSMLAKDKIDSLDDLVSRIHEILGEDHGLGEDLDKVEQARKAMEAYDCRLYDWIKHANYAGGRYTRNLVDRGSKKFNLLLLVWAPGGESPIHDHANSHCILKVLDGALEEELYIQRGKAEGIGSASLPALGLKSTTTLKANEIGYINDSVGYHRMSNYGKELAMSLHLYSPPFDTCHIINKDSGEQIISHCNSYYNSTPDATNCCKADSGMDITE